MKTTRLLSPLLPLWLLCCNSPGRTTGAPAPEPTATRTPAPPSGPASAQGAPAASQRLELRGAASEILVTIRLEGSERVVELAGGATLRGEQKPKHPEKTQYQSAAGARYEIKEGEAGFKLRDGEGRLLWKVKLHEDKAKISDNEEGLRPFELEPKDAGRIKLKREGKELGKAECREGKVKIEDEAGKDRFSARTDPAIGRCSGAGTLLLIADMPGPERALLMAELWARGR